MKCVLVLLVTLITLMAFALDWVHRAGTAADRQDRNVCRAAQPGGRLAQPGRQDRALRLPLPCLLPRPCRFFPAPAITPRLPNASNRDRSQLLVAWRSPGPSIEQPPTAAAGGTPMGTPPVGRNLPPLAEINRRAQHHDVVSHSCVATRGWNRPQLLSLFCARCCWCPCPHCWLCCSRCCAPAVDSGLRGFSGSN